MLPIPTGRQLYVDETKEHGLLMVAAYVAPEHCTETRRAMRTLRRPGAKRFHFTEADRGERQSALNLIESLCGTTDLRLVVYRSSLRRHADARDQCVEAIANDALTAEASSITFELDEPARRGDLRILARTVRNHPRPPRYGHLTAAEEPLLWISDGIAWCLQRGGHWASTARRLSDEVTDLGDA